MTDAPHVAHHKHAPSRLAFAIVTISDTRRGAEDTGGALCVELVARAGHSLVGRRQIPDDVAQIQATIRELVADADADVIVTTGGTGISGRDVTPEALAPLLDKELPGFGELFRSMSVREVGAAGMASRAFAGVIRGRILFALPGSPDACKLALEKLILPEAGHLVSQARRNVSRHA